MSDETSKKEKGLGEVLVDLIESTSNKKIEIAKSDIYEKQDAFFQDALKKTEEKANKIIEETEQRIKKEIESVKKDMFVTFGIFTSFIAFIVGEINILKTINSVFDKLGFSFLFVSFILGFLFGMMFLFDDEKLNGKFKKMVGVFFVFFIIGICFILLPLILQRPAYYMILN